MRVTECLVTFCGETHFAGLPCALIRFSGCDLRCAWCDTTYSYQEGEKKSIDELVSWVEQTKMNLVLLTGGEPLLQKDLPQLAKILARNHKVLVETSGAHDVSCLPAPIVRSVDVKCPSSGESARMKMSCLSQLREGDAVKMVIGSREDYEYAKEIISRYEIGEPVNILLSSAYPHIRCEQLAGWILEDKLAHVRLNVQLHRLLWPNIENLKQENFR